MSTKAKVWLSIIGGLVVLGLISNCSEKNKNQDAPSVDTTTSRKTTEYYSPTTEERTTAHIHNWSKTCGKSSICVDCGEDDGIILEHSTDLGMCEYCKQEFRKRSPVTIIGRTWEQDYLGGVQWTFKLRNNTDKQIKYITLQWTCYNAVGDFVYDDIDGDNYVRVKYTGPLDAYSTTNYIQNSTKFYDHNFNNSTITEIIVEYMDGTTEKVTKYHDNISE